MILCVCVCTSSRKNRSEEIPHSNRSEKEITKSKSKLENHAVSFDRRQRVIGMELGWENTEQWRLPGDDYDPSSPPQPLRVGVLMRRAKGAKRRGRLRRITETNATSRKKWLEICEAPWDDIHHCSVSSWKTKMDDDHVHMTLEQSVSLSENVSRWHLARSSSAVLAGVFGLFLWHRFLKTTF